MRTNKHTHTDRQRKFKKCTKLFLVLGKSLGLCERWFWAYHWVYVNVGFKRTVGKINSELRVVIRRKDEYEMKI